MLEQSHPKTKVVALKAALIKRPRKWERFGNAFRRSAWCRLHIIQQALRTDRALIDLHNPAALINEERCWDAKISATVKHIPVNDVVDARNFFATEQDRE